MWRGLGEEDCTVDRRCGEAFKKLLVGVPLNGGDRHLLGSVVSEGSTWWLEEVGWFIHLL